MTRLLFMIVVFSAFAKAYAQQPTPVSGKIIPDFGQTYPIENPNFKTDTKATFKMVFDIAKAPEDPSILNPYLNTLARFLNMHHRAGVPVTQLHVRAAIHGEAAYGMLKDRYYQEKYGVPNPNIQLLKALDQAGVEIVLCGQTAGARNITSARRLELVDTALSAMTVIAQSQQEGYTLIAF